MRFLQLNRENLCLRFFRNFCIFLFLYLFRGFLVVVVKRRGIPGVNADDEINLGIVIKLILVDEDVTEFVEIIVEVGIRKGASVVEVVKAVVGRNDVVALVVEVATLIGVGSGIGMGIGIGITKELVVALVVETVEICIVELIEVVGMLFCEIFSCVV